MRRNASGGSHTLRRISSLGNDSSVRFHITAKTLAVMSFGIAVLGLIDGLIPQTEMILTGGSIPVPTAILKVMFLVVALTAILWRPHSIRPNRFGMVWVLMVVYLMVAAVYLNLHFGTPAFELITGFNSYYTFFIFCTFAVFFENEISEKSAMRWLFLVFLLCFLVGAAQSIAQKPLLYVESNDGSFAVSSYESVGVIRSFSLFGSSYGYGTFCSLIGAVSLSALMLHRKKMVPSLIFLCSVLACYSTFTRNSYLQFFCVGLTVYLLVKKRMARFAKYSPWLFLFLSVLVMVRGSAGEATDSAVTSNSSLVLRVAEWAYYLNMYAAASLIEKLFGLGVIQTGKAATDVLFAVDNQYLGILMHIGIIGFVLIFWLHWKIWIWLYNRAIVYRSAFAIGMAGVWSSFMSVYFFNMGIATFSVMVILALVVNPQRAKRIASNRVVHKPLTAV